MKRSLNDSSSESDLDEPVEVEKDSGDETGQLDSLSASTNTQVQARKRRRGIIEKRRRDRINNSLSELRRLVPSAFEKQGSTKLEKAEILQMTVDHLKMLHASGGKGLLDAHALAKDFHALGFRECLAEASRFLGVVEGRDPADPLRLRLVSHLSSYASQREVHTGLEQLAWGAAYGAAPAHLPHPLLLQHPPGRTPAPRANSRPPSTSSSAEATSRLGVLPPPESLRVPLSLHLPATKLSPPLLSSVSSFPLSFIPLVPPSSLSAVGPPSGLSKPYRPWGTEIGAF